MPQKDDITTQDKVVMIVPARLAWKRYDELHIHADVRTKNARQADYLAFYFNNEIKITVPKIKSMVGLINITNHEQLECKVPDQANRQTAKALRNNPFEHEIENSFNEPLTIMFLTAPDDEATITLDNPIENDKLDKNNKRTAFRQSAPAYATLDSFIKASKTSQLVLL